MGDVIVDLRDLHDGLDIQMVEKQPTHSL
jgi:hypothetical protein